MLDSKSSMITSLLVFLVIIVIYRIVTYFASQNEKFEKIVEGEPLYVIQDGMFVLLENKSHTFAQDEFFAEIRQAGVDHLGQIETAILETNGTISFFYFVDDKVKPGLPVKPKQYDKRTNKIKIEDNYCCTYCGNPERLTIGTFRCTRCNHEEWVKAENSKRTP